MIIQFLKITLGSLSTKFIAQKSPWTRKLPCQKKEIVSATTKFGMCQKGDGP